MNKAMLKNVSQFLDGEKKLIAIAFSLFLVNQVIDLFLIRLFSENGALLHCKLDCQWYSGIAEKGYEHPMGALTYSETKNWAFFPLFPLAVRGLATILDLRYDTAAILTSKLLFLVAIYSFMKLANVYFSGHNPIATAAVAALNPYSIYGNMGYTEPLFLVLTSIFFIQLRASRMFPAALAGMLLTGTRFPGISALAPYALTIGRKWKLWSVMEKIVSAIGFLVISFGLLAFMYHLNEIVGDPLAFVHIQKAWRGERVLSAFGWIDSLRRGFSSSTWLYRYFSISGFVVLGTSFYFLWNPRYRVLASFTFISTILPLMSDAWGLPRYIWWQAPVLLCVNAIINRNGVYIFSWLSIALLINIACYRQLFSTVPWLIS